MVRRPWILIASLLAVQLACLVVGVLWFAGWHEDAWRQALNTQHIDYDRRWAEQLAGEAAERVAREVSPGTDGVAARFDDVLPDLALPRGWHACVMALDGTLVADPRLPNGVACPTARPGLWLIHDGQRYRTMGELLATGRPVVSGLARVGDDIDLVAAQRIGGMPHFLVLQRRLPATAVDIGDAGVTVRWVGLAIAAMVVLLTGLVTARLVRRYERRVAALNQRLERKVVERTSALVRARDAIIFGLARLADSRDRETGEHVSRIQHLSVLLAREMRATHPEIDDVWLERLRMASALHDIGKVGIPDAILLKPGPLTPEERTAMQDHTEIGAECLAAIGERMGDSDLLAMARDIALAHHERWDGSGYPRGLQGTDIPLAARIVAVADVYDAVSSTRVYKRGQSHDAVRALIVGSRGSQFDPAVVDAFLRVEQQCQAVLKTERARTGAVARRLVRLPALVSVN